jgi:ACS family pantothenate transporter-like MFS transporter
MWWAKHPESRLLVKIDFFILSFCCVTYFFNYLDRSNLTNAYVSGMEEELGFEGNQFNVINTVFTVGYILGRSLLIWHSPTFHRASSSRL